MSLLIFLQQAQSHCGLKTIQIEMKKKWKQIPGTFIANNFPITICWHKYDKYNKLYLKHSKTAFLRYWFGV